jgi:hypothetical protein
MCQDYIKKIESKYEHEPDDLLFNFQKKQDSASSTPMTHLNSSTLYKNNFVTFKSASSKCSNPLYTRTTS